METPDSFDADFDVLVEQAFGVALQALTAEGQLLPFACLISSEGKLGHAVLNHALERPDAVEAELALLERLREVEKSGTIRALALCRPVNLAQADQPPVRGLAIQIEGAREQQARLLIWDVTLHGPGQAPTFGQPTLDLVARSVLG